MILKIVVAVCLLLNGCAVYPQYNWELTRDENGIKVYTSKQGSSGFKSIKVEAVFTATITKLVTLLKDVSNNKNWVYNTKQSHLLKEINENNIIYYAETNLPVIRNRDMAIRMQFNHDTINNTLKVVATGVADVVPEKKGIVRIPYFRGIWHVRETGNTITINYILNVDPGGSISPLINNIFVSKGPFETFNNLAGILKK